MKHSVKQLAKISGVSVRTLHHYDHLGLLKPCERTEKGYRLYGERELLRLQQILFYKTLGFRLESIKSLLDEPDFDQVRALREHRNALIKKRLHVQHLIETIDKTIGKLTNEEIMKDEELYAGFSPEQRKSYRQEASERWGNDQVQMAEANLRSLGKNGLKKLKQEGEEINELLASLMHVQATDERVQKLVEKHYKHLNQYRTIPKEEYRALGQMYVEDERFTKYYDQYKVGLAKFLNEAIQVFCQS